VADNDVAMVTFVTVALRSYKETSTKYGTPLPMLLKKTVPLFANVTTRSLTAMRNTSPGANVVSAL
jgi:hypothetical protein